MNYNSKAIVVIDRVIKIITIKKIWNKKCVFFFCSVNEPRHRNMDMNDSDSICDSKLLISNFKVEKPYTQHMVEHF